MKYRVKSKLKEEYRVNESRVVYYIQKKVMGIWSNHTDPTTDKDWAYKTCDILNATSTGDNKYAYVIYVEQTSEQETDGLADLSIVNHKTHAIRRLKDVAFTANKLKITE